MKIDITLKITPQMVTDAQGNEKKALVGHLGTHFDVMDKEFPLEYTKRNGIVFDVSKVKNREIDIVDIDMDKVKKICLYVSIPDLLKKKDMEQRNILQNIPSSQTSCLKHFCRKTYL